MQLFTRSIHLAGPPTEVLSYASDMRSLVSDKIGREVALWSAWFGAPAGTYVYAMRVDGLADLAAMTATLPADADYRAQLVKGTDFMTGPATDNLAQPMHGSLGDPPPVGSVAAVTSATIGNGQYVAAITWSIDVAKHVEQVTGLPAMFLTNEYGPFGEVTWISVAPNAAAVDMASQKINVDSTYIEMITSAAQFFIPGSGHRSLARRIA